MFVMRMRISLNLIISIWTGDKKQWYEKIFIAFSPHESKPRCIFESFCAKTEINLTILRRRCLSTNQLYLKTDFKMF